MTPRWHPRTSWLPGYPAYSLYDELRRACIYNSSSLVDRHPISLHSINQFTFPIYCDIISRILTFLLPIVMLLRTFWSLSYSI